MAGHDATTLTFVRTPGGVVKVAAGQRVPEDALPGELDRLTRAGCVVEASDGGTAGEGTETEPDQAEPVEQAKPRRTRKGADD